MKRKDFVEFAKKVVELAETYGVRGEWDHSTASGYYFFETDTAEPSYRMTNKKEGFDFSDFDYLTEDE